MTMATEESTDDGPTKEQWNAVRLLLKTDLPQGKIPIESSEKKPKAVWQGHIDKKNADIVCINCNKKRTQEKFSRMLRSLRKAHKDGDLENEGNDKVTQWGKSAAKQFLKKCFREKAIATDFSDPKEVWQNHCHGRRAFSRMRCDSVFVRRLASVRDDHLKKLSRCQSDSEAHRIAKENHPTPKLNSQGEPQWNGSEAQKHLKELIAQGKHKDNTPEEMWSKNPAHQVHSKQTFRDHIHQEERLKKFNKFVESTKKGRFDELQC